MEPESSRGSTLEVDNGPLKDALQEGFVHFHQESQQQFEAPKPAEFQIQSPVDEGEAPSKRTKT